MSFEPLLLTVDSSSLGKFNHGSISQQTSMELHVDNASSKRAFQDENGEYLDIKDWPALKFNEDDMVTEIDWDCWKVDHVVLREGSIDIEWIPRTVTYFDIGGSQMEGEIDFRAFPPEINRIIMFGNAFNGSVCLASLFEDLQELDIGDCAFCGSLELARAPRSMEKLYAYNNHLWGTLDLTALPDTLGSIDLTQLPQLLKVLCLSQNAFTGTIDLTKLPGGLQALLLMRNKVTGSIDMTKLPTSLENLNFAWNLLCGSFFLPVVHDILVYLHASGNNFEGKAVIGHIPGAITKIYVQKCKISEVVGIDLKPNPTHRKVRI